MRVLVTGDRNWTDSWVLWGVLDDVHDAEPIDVLIEGCATGADQLAGDHGPAVLGGPGGAVGWAWVWGVAGDHHPAHWRHGESCPPDCRRAIGRAAGPIRNGEMLAEGRPDLVVAFHLDIARSRGTRDMVNRALRAGVPVLLVDGSGVRELTEEVL